MFTNPPIEEIAALLRRAHVIAVVGLSADPGRPSHRVAKALQGFGYRIIPVTPTAPQVLGARSVPDLDHLGEVVADTGPVDIVDVFRRQEYVAGVVADCIRLGLPALWLQEGVVDEAAALQARAAGIFTVMDRCLLRDRASLGHPG
jgi:predicted CoA-binding protein